MTKETVMKTIVLTRVSFGSIKALTQQDVTGDYLEANFQPSRIPM
jgi:hypothetical protein